MNFNEHLLEAVNSRDMVVRSIGTWTPNQFGETNIITIEGSTHRITFITNALHGVNYFKMYQAHDLKKNRVYRASRYLHKYVNLISQINGEAYVNNKK